MHVRSRFVLSFLLVGLVSACSSFDGRAVDAGAPADMNVAVDAGADAGDGAVEPDAGMDPLVIVPAVAPTSAPAQITIVTRDNVTPRDILNNAPPRDEPYCLAIDSNHSPGGVRWATCEANENPMTCTRDSANRCPEYPTPDRALACAFGTSGRRPTCVPLQYSFEERCGTCGSTSANVCVFGPTGRVECVSNPPDATLMGSVCGRFDGESVVGVVETGLDTVCAPNADCYFDVDGAAKCAEPAEQRPLYPVRGCNSAARYERECSVQRDETPYSVEAIRWGDAIGCSATRPPGWTTDWLAESWRYLTSSTSEAAPCESGLLCDLRGTSPTCTAPSWTAVTSGSIGRCGDCLGVPCFVYEDGSYECMHKPTRDVDAARSRETTIGCCQRLPNGDFQPGTCRAAGDFAAAFGVDRCALGQACAFTAAGVATCR